ncbi:MAG TPA: NADH-quinone oxidoreductase subunit J [Gemmatirosa sp.]|jgi:NADH-quinone oxidoreductase subunit J|nr:NADH-quinone oxidoreductase subunit J [Gemmatirosa sp.]
MTAERFFFYLFGLIACASALLFVTRRSPVAAALWLVQTMFALAGLYVMLDAQFVGAVQVLVYAGAIMVVFLFVVMLLNLGHGDEMVDIQRNGVRVAAGGLGLALLAVLLAAVGGRNGTLVPSGAAVVTYDAAAPVNVVSPVAAVLFREQLLAFEITSVLLLAAIVGAVVLAKRRAAA